MLSNFGSIQYVIEQKNSEGTFFEISVLVEILSLQNYDIISKQFLSDFPMCLMVNLTYI